MKKKNFIIVLTFVISIHSYVFADWSKVGANVERDSFYLDYDRIRKDSGQIYFWYLVDYPKVNKFGDRSDLTYAKVKCGELKYKWLQVTYYDSHMGTGKINAKGDESDWKYPVPDSIIEDVINSVCNY